MAAARLSAAAAATRWTRIAVNVVLGTILLLAGYTYWDEQAQPVPQPVAASQPAAEPGRSRPSLTPRMRVAAVKSGFVCVSEAALNEAADHLYARRADKFAAMFRQGLCRHIPAAERFRIKQARAGVVEMLAERSERTSDHTLDVWAFAELVSPAP